MAIFIYIFINITERPTTCLELADQLHPSQLGAKSINI